MYLNLSHKQMQAHYSNVQNKVKQQSQLTSELTFFFFLYTHKLGRVSFNQETDVM